MIILKRTGEKIVSTHEVYLDIFRQAWGLRFASLLVDKALVFEMASPRKIYADNLFVFQTIDIVWLNEKFEVIDVKQSILPFTLFVTHKGKAKYMIEFVQGTIKKFLIQKGDVLHLKNGDSKKSKF